jgi:uracil-DNA glycosylase
LPTSVERTDETVEYIADEDRNPFGMQPPCDRFVPGYGDTAAHFHVIGDSPAVHGGLDTGIPFTDRPWSTDFFDALAEGGLVDHVDLAASKLKPGLTFLSYLHMCDPGEKAPIAANYDALEPFFDAELRAITAHVLLPVGARATAHVLDTYTARQATDIDMDAIHATEIRGSGWLVVPIKDPSEWIADDAERLVDGLSALKQQDYRQTSDLGRFLAGDESYLVR